MLPAVPFNSGDPFAVRRAASAAEMAEHCAALPDSGAMAARAAPRAGRPLAGAPDGGGAGIARTALLNEVLCGVMTMCCHAKSVLGSAPSIARLPPARG